MSSTLISPEASADHEAAGGCAWLAAWASVCVFALGAGLVLLVVLTGEAGAYGLAALGALVVCGFGVVMLVPAAVLWTVHRLRNHPSHRRRATVALVPLVGSVVFLSWLGADLTGWLGSPVEPALATSAGVTLLALAAVLAVEHDERHPAWAFAICWILLIGSLGYRAWTDLRVEVVWLGPSVVLPTPGVIGFSATRSGNVEIRFGAGSCGDGRVIATGRYTWRPGDPGSSYGATMWVDLPPDVLPLQPGDLVRVCVRDGFAGGTAAGVEGDPPSFWPRD